MGEILITNDDGVLSEGIQILAERLKALGRNITVVAPSQEQSTTGHALTLHKPIRLEKMKPGYYHINGTPPDCVLIAAKKLLRNKKIDLVVSGINRGPNMGNDIHYSGTVAAAREATFLKIPAMAVSLDFYHGESPHFHVAAEYTFYLARLFLKCGMPEQVLINVNVPDRPMHQIRGIKITKTGFRYYQDRMVEQKDPRGKSYYWLSGKYAGYDKHILGSDCHAVDQGYVSITPLYIDTSHQKTIQKLKKWKFSKIHETVQKSL